MSEQDNGQVSTLQRPTTDNPEEWKPYWQAKGLPWRTEPEIDSERRKYLTKRRIAVADTEGEVYPFKDVRLSRADIEWLSVTQDRQKLLNENRRAGEGMDLRGAILDHLNLSSLPLEDVNLSHAHIEGSDLKYVHLERANLFNTHLERACLLGACLREATLVMAHLHSVELRWGRLQNANLAHAHLEGSNLMEVHLENSILNLAHLECSNLWMAHLEGAELMGAHLEKACLREVHFAGAKLYDTILIDDKHVGPVLVDIQWGDTNLTVVDWPNVRILGDEYLVEQDSPAKQLKDRPTRFGSYGEAVRAYRQLSVALRNQGLNEDAARFAYRAQLMQRKLYWHQRKFGQYLLSLLLDLLSGYGYKPGRSFIAYLIVIAAFAVTYFIIGQTAGPSLSPLGSFVFSMTSFHGRGFFPGGIGLDDPLTVVAAFEAFIGLLIEVTFIATLTQRLFGK